jgi:hypothetical protein
MIGRNQPAIRTNLQCILCILMLAAYSCSILQSAATKQRAVFPGLLRSSYAVRNRGSVRFLLQLRGGVFSDEAFDTASDQGATEVDFGEAESKQKKPKFGKKTELGEKVSNKQKQKYWSRERQKKKQREALDMDDEELEVLRNTCKCSMGPCTASSTCTHTDIHACTGRKRERERERESS